MRMFRNLRNRRSFQKTLADTDDGEMVCGTVDLDGNPLYFTMPREATDREVRAEAFRVRHGRRMSHLEEKLLDIAEMRSP